MTRSLSRIAAALVTTAAVSATHATFGAVSLRAQAKPSMLVSTSWLAEHARDPNLVVLHVGNKAQYDSGHAPGARHVTLAELSLPQVEGGLTLQMASVEQLTAWAIANGISNQSRVVIVPHDENLQSATRVFITMAYLGAFDRTSLLDGGFKAWKAENRTVTTDAPPAPKAVTFVAKPRPELLATLAQVEAVTKDSGRTALIDARLPRFYNGDGGGYPRPGHIPTAVNIPLTTVSSNGFMKPASELKTLFSQAGVHGDKPIITYCHIGQQATVLWFVSTLLGYDAKMFDGSFQEWSGTARLPLMAPPAK
jgi:thiosulfate/3-mercaptopyruvate sulfurtransferase